MTSFRNISLVCGVVTAIGLPALAGAAEPAQSYRPGQEGMAGQIPVACAGVGQEREDPRWNAYPVRLEFADPKGDLLAGVTVTLADSKGATLLTINCDAPWVLLKPPPGHYTVHAALNRSADKPRTAAVNVPAGGQNRIGITFPN